jgi:hypothetical protein
MENDPDKLLDQDDATIGDETDDVDVDDDDIDAHDGGDDQGALDPTKDIMNDDRTPDDDAAVTAATATADGASR